MDRILNDAAEEDDTSDFEETGFRCQVVLFELREIVKYYCNTMKWKNDFNY